jgi:DNA-directed RNA polymerase specialized sigma24 family protein
MAFTEQVTQWITQLGRGDAQAAQVLWERYFSKLVRLARRELGTMPRRVADEEDVALSAMHSFCRGMAEHRFLDVRNEDNLWKLLVTITARKACAQRRRHFAGKRGKGLVRGESVFAALGDEQPHVEGIAGVLGHEPTPELACMVAEDCRRLLERLGDDVLRQVAVRTLEGYSTAEIAEQLGCLQRTVQRKLKAIRAIWSEEAPP